MNTDHHAILLGLCIVVMAVTFAAMLASIVHHRHGATSAGRPFWARAALEVAWGLIPCLMVAEAVWPSIDKPHRSAPVVHHTSAVARATLGRTS